MKLYMGSRKVVVLCVLALAGLLVATSWGMDDLSKVDDYEGYLIHKGAVGSDDEGDDDLMMDRVMGIGGGMGINRCSQCGSACRHKCGTRGFRSCCLRLIRKRRPAAPPRQHQQQPRPSLQVDYQSDTVGDIDFD